MKSLKVRWTGFRPLVMSNPQVVDVENPYSISQREINKRIKDARKKGDEDMLIQISREQKKADFCASAYFDEERGCFFIPDSSILACIRAGATMMKKGKDIERAVIMRETEAVVKLPSGRKFPTLAEAYEDRSMRLEVPAKIPPKTGALMWKVRCSMPTGWTIEFTVDFDETIITETTLINAMGNGGKFCGLGTWRPKFGRFSVEVESE